MKSECSCEPSVRELRAHIPHNSSNRCQDPKQTEDKAEDKISLRQDETLFRTGNRITPPTARVKQSEWSRKSGSSKTHLSVYKQFCCRSVDALTLVVAVARQCFQLTRTSSDTSRQRISQQEFPGYSHSICDISLVGLRVQIELLLALQPYAHLAT